MEINNKTEQKYFLAYACYHKGKELMTFVNRVVYIDEPITDCLINDIQADLLKELQEENLNIYAVQIVAMNKVD